MSPNDRDNPDTVPLPAAEQSTGGWRVALLFAVFAVVGGAGVWFALWGGPKAMKAVDRAARPQEPAAPIGSAAKPGSAIKAPASGLEPAGSGSKATDERVRDAASLATDVSDSVEEVRSRITEEQLASQRRTLDPSKDGWDSEALSEDINGRLKKLAKLLASPGEIDRESLASYVAADFECGPLRDLESAPVYDDGVVEITRSDATLSGARYQGVDGLVEALAEVMAPFAGVDHPHVKFKLFRIEPGSPVTKTTAYFHVFGVTPDGPKEINSTWDCSWGDVGDQRVELLRIGVRDSEEASARVAGTMFTDRTEAVLGETDLYRDRLSVGVGEWRNRLESNLNLQYHGHFGLAIGDVNGDGLDDLYVGQPGGLPNALLLQQMDGTVRDVAAESGVDFLNYTRGALFVDLDNDGDQDLVLTVIDEVAILENDGAGRFSIGAEFPEIKGAYSIAAADFDNDRDLDLYVCRHKGEGVEKGEFPVPYPYYDANNGGTNFFLRNDGDWRFIDATTEYGFDKDNTRFSFAASWEDYDNDGDLDLYVANDFGRNTLYRNDGGRFESVADSVGLDDTAFGMSVSWGDYNRDGLMDMYVGNMFSAAGNRITFQDAFRPESSDEARRRYQRTARGNSLFQNMGNGVFRDVSEESAVSLGRWSWASLFADINNDGWEDLMVTNGFVTGETIDDL